MNDLVIPEYLKDMMVADEMKSESLISTTSSVPRISTRGKVFRLIVDGDEVAKYKESLDVIVLGVQPAHGFCKTYYESGYNPDASDPPDCSSTNGVRPDSWISSPVSPTCASCPKNKWGSAQAMDKKKKAKACRDSKRLHVLIPAYDKDIKEGPIFIFTVTVNSLKNLSEFGKELHRLNVPTMSALITRISMDDEAEVPLVHFKPVGFLKEAVGTITIERAKEKPWEQASTGQAKLEDQSTKHEALESAQENKPSADNQSVDDLIGEWG